MMRIASIETDDVANGKGFGVVVWVQGCRVNCKGCQNIETWDFSKGREITVDDTSYIINELRRPEIKRITISGGHPFEPENAEDVLALVQFVKENFSSKSIWIYSGLTYEELILNTTYKNILKYCDVLVDGPFILEQRDVTLAFRGSKNQRIIDVQKSLEKNEVILFE